MSHNRYTRLVLTGTVLGAVVVVVAWILLGPGYAVPLLGLAALCLAALGLLRARARPGTDPGGDRAPGVNQPLQEDRPLGDTPEAHDEISPHDLPITHPGRRAAERQAAGAATATTRGHREGGAAGRGDDPGSERLDEREREGAELHRG